MRDHLPEYFAEFIGTALMMILGIGAVTLMWAADSPVPRAIPSEDLRRLITGMMFAGGATLVVLSRFGQRSGGHINPAVTLAFWWQGKIATRDAIAYAVAQILGALLGILVIERAGSEWASQVHLGMTLPGSGYSPLAAFIAEVVITFLLVGTIFYCVAHERIAGKTPYIAGSLVAFLVFVEAPISGTSLNPARSFAPALFMHDFDHHWIYWVGPPLGALFAAVLFGVVFPQEKHRGCAKLFHTERYRCIFPDCGYTRVEKGTVLLREGDAADRAYVLERGELEVRKQNKPIATLGPGSWVGEMSLILGLPRSASVVALTDCQLRSVTTENLVHVIEEHPAETARLLKQLAGRLHRMDEKIVLEAPYE